jgi:hypothetical protein
MAASLIVYSDMNAKSKTKDIFGYIALNCASCFSADVKIFGLVTVVRFWVIEEDILRL